MNNSPLHYVRPQNAVAFEFDEFSYHFDLAMAAGALRMPVANPQQTGFVLVDEDGSEEAYRFGDHPMNRAAFAVKQSFNDALKFMSFMWRFWALMDLLRDDGLPPWCQPSTETEGAIIIPSEILDVARRMRMNKRGAFNAPRFRKLVAQSAV